MNLPEEIEKILRSTPTDEQLRNALEKLEQSVGVNDADDSYNYFIQGKILWRLGQRNRATTAYLRAAELNPDSPAVQALEHARAIESFFNPDLLNP